MKPFSNQPEVALNLLDELRQRYLEPLDEKKLYSIQYRTHLSTAARFPLEGKSLKEIFDRYNSDRPYGPEGAIYGLGFETEVKKAAKGKPPVEPKFRHPLTAVAYFNRGVTDSLQKLAGNPNVADALAFQIPVTRLTSGLQRSELNFIQDFIEKAMTLLDGCLYTIAIMPSLTDPEIMIEPTSQPFNNDGPMEIKFNQNLDKKVRGYGHWRTGLTAGHLEGLGGEAGLKASGIPFRKYQAGEKTVWELQTGDSPLTVEPELRRATRVFFEPIQMFSQVPYSAWEERIRRQSVWELYFKNQFYDLQLDVPEWVDPGDLYYPRITLPEGVVMVEDEAPLL